MALSLPDRWIWDSWYTWDGDVCHVFYLCASKGLAHPEERHRAPSIGHAISTDLINWTVLADALAPSQTSGFDSWTTWTGSVVKDDEGQWNMFYTGSSREDGGLVQRIGVAVSDDLMAWRKLDDPIIEADPQWYETLEQAQWPDQAWRDPWVFRPEGSETWRMLITARHRTGNPATRGALGIATSPDLRSWTVQPPLSEPDQGFGQLEVFQYAEVDGVPLLMFCCGWRELSEQRVADVGTIDTTYSVVVNPDLHAIDFREAQPLLDPPLYAARLVQKPTGEWFLLGFVGYVDGEFVGEISDPIRVGASSHRGLFVVD